MAIVEMDRRNFLTFGFARGRRSGGGQPPRRPFQPDTPLGQPPEGNWFGKKVSRRTLVETGSLLVGLGVGVFIADRLGLLKFFPTLPEQEPEPTPTSIPTIATPEALDSRLLRTIEERVFRLNDYTLNLRQKMRGFWTEGVNGVVQYSGKDGKSYLLSFTPAKADEQLQDFAKTTITLQRLALSSGGSALVFSLAGFYNPLVEDKKLDQDTQNRMQSMNIDHEIFISIAYTNGMIAIGESLGLNFSLPSEKVTDEENKLLQAGKYLPRMETWAEAVAEINDYILTYPLLDKNPQTGNLLYARIQGNPDPLPIIQGKAILEGGLTFIVDSTIGLSLRQFSGWEQLSQKYPRLQDIPNYQEYLAKIEQHYQAIYQ